MLHGTGLKKFFPAVGVLCSLVHVFRQIIYLKEPFPESLEEPVPVIALPVEDEESFIIAPDELLPGEFILLKDDLSLSIRNNVIHFLSIFP
jgi:hypothetical protein